MTTNDLRSLPPGLTLPPNCLLDTHTWMYHRPSNLMCPKLCSLYPFYNLSPTNIQVNGTTLQPPTWKPGSIQAPSRSHLWAVNSVLGYSREQKWDKSSTSIASDPLNFLPVFPRFSNPCLPWPSRITAAAFPPSIFLSSDPFSTLPTDWSLIFQNHKSHPGTHFPLNILPWFPSASQVKSLFCQANQTTCILDLCLSFSLIPWHSLIHTSYSKVLGILMINHVFLMSSCLSIWSSPARNSVFPSNGPYTYNGFRWFVKIKKYSQ